MGRRKQGEIHGDSILTEPILKAENITKSFAGHKVLDGVDFGAESGQVHSLVGENGAGKSTLMKIVGGLYQPDAGTIYLDGQPVSFSTPWQAMQAGISIVHQELSLAPNLNVAQNIFIRRENSNRLGFVNWKQLYNVTSELFDRIGVDISPTAQVSDFSVGMQQIIEIAKALSFNAKVIIMDEPTSALSEAEVDRLYTIVRDLKQRGVAVIFISHKLGEVFRISDAISVLRDGQMIGTVEPTKSSHTDVIRMMVGRHIEDLYPARSSGVSDEILVVRNLSNPPHFDNINFELRKGEILGFAGLVGSGRTEVARAIFGADRRRTGEILLHGEPVNVHSPRDAIKHGIVYLTEDRKSLGLFLNMPVRQNIVSAALDRFVSRSNMLRHKAIEEESQRFVAEMEIRPFNDEVLMLNLSGGNQQKSLLAKLLCASPKILIADEPTRGVDVGAKARIHEHLRQLAEEGVEVIVISSELPEVLGLSDRVAVFHEGRITAFLDGETATQEEVMHYATK